MMLNSKEVGKRVKEARKELGMTQLELADKVGVTEGSVRKIENGHSGGSLDTWIEISEVMNQSLDYLLKGKKTAVMLVEEMNKNSDEKEIQNISRIIHYFLKEMKKQE